MVSYYTPTSPPRHLPFFYADRCGDVRNFSSLFVCNANLSYRQTPRMITISIFIDGLLTNHNCSPFVGERISGKSLGLTAGDSFSLHPCSPPLNFAFIITMSMSLLLFVESQPKIISCALLNETPLFFLSFLFPIIHRCYSSPKMQIHILTAVSVYQRVLIAQVF